jgi:hypothetical protein
VPIGNDDGDFDIMAVFVVVDGIVAFIGAKA